MKRLGWLLPLFLALTCVGVFATTINYQITSATLDIQPNGGEGENVSFTFVGPQVNAYGIAGTPYYWFSDDEGMDPGSMGGGSTALMPEYVAMGHIGRHGPDDIQLNCCTATLFAGTFTFPTNGKDFTVKLAASISGITGTFNSSGNTFTISPISGTLTMSFFYSSYWNQYFASSASFSSSAPTPTPEPGTLALMGTGIAAMVVAVRRKLKI